MKNKKMESKNRIENILNLFIMLSILGSFSYILNSLKLKVFEQTIQIITIIVSNLLFTKMLFNYKKIKNLLRYKLFFIFIIFSITSYLWSYHPVETLKKLVILVSYTLYGVYVVEDYSIKFFFKTLNKALIIGGFLSLIVCVGFENLGVINKPYWNGIYGNKNNLGRNSILGLILIYDFLKMKNKNYIYFLIAFVYVVNLFYSGSKTSIAIFVVSNILYKIFNRLNKKTIVRNILISVLIFIFIIIFVEKFNFFIVKILKKDITFTGRTYIWDMAINSWFKNPWLGNGFFATWDTNKLYFLKDHYEKIGHAHNGYIETLSQLGIIGLGLYLYIMYRALDNLEKLKKILREYEKVYQLLLFFIFYNFFESYAVSGEFLNWFLLVFCFKKLKKEMYCKMRRIKSNENKFFVSKVIK